MATHPTSPNTSAARMACLIGVMVVLSAVDLALTLTLMRTTGMYESNPLAAAVVRHGVWALAAYKLATVTLAASLLWTARATRLGCVGGWVSVLVLSALSVHWGNVLNQVASNGGDWGGEPTVQGATWVCLAESR